MAAQIDYHDMTYRDMLQDVLEHGEKRSDRTGTGTFGLFSSMGTFTLNKTFPLITSKRVHWKSVVHELLWFMSGDTNIKYLKDNGVSIWDEWADEDGNLGPVYGKQWRSWTAPNGESIDQLKNLIEGLKSDPFSRRHVVSAWNPGEIPDMALPPCHVLFQFWVSADDNSLSCQLYQRSADMFLGVPFNIASYSLLTCILADTLGFERGQFHWIGGDTHIYSNHEDQAREQLKRPYDRPGPKLAKILKSDPLAVTFDDIKLEGYDPHPAIKAPVAV